MHPPREDGKHLWRFYAPLSLPADGAELASVGRRRGPETPPMASAHRQGTEGLHTVPDPWKPAARPEAYALPEMDESAQAVRADFARYFEQHLTRLIRHLMRQGAGAHEAAEAAQAAFAEAFPRWGHISHPAAWLRRVAFRLYLRQPVRGEELTGEPPDVPGGVCPLRVVELREEERWVYAALGGLPPAQRQVLAWSLDGFSTSEISAELNMAADAVRQNLSRARARLKVQLGLAHGGGQ
ncbi:RNA polymerase sigma factor [Streptomyces sp. HUAS TT7]|uniref:RNA polymerase sigma factor n=1 Tax=Streptomyces sp. HUAS TT7 TaxID=3447507 RepID=UPI003F65FE8E